jgi:hypothetical protein
MGVTIINYQGVVEFGRTIYPGNLKMVSISAAGILMDTVECKLNHSGPAIDQGLTYSFIRTDGY